MQNVHFKEAILAGNIREINNKNAVFRSNSIGRMTWIALLFSVGDIFAYHITGSMEAKPT
jgi:hypothetical protein